MAIYNILHTLQKIIMMRKPLVFLLCLSLACSLKGQEMTGVWVQANSASENGTEMTVSDTLRLSSDGVFRNATVMEMSMDDGNGQKATVKMMVSCSGKWSYEDGVLTQIYDAKSIRSEVLEQPEGFPKMFVNMLTKKTASEFKKHAKKPQRSELLTLTSNTLKLREIGVKDPETDTYAREENLL